MWFNEQGTAARNAIAEISCVPGRKVEAAARIVEQPESFSVKIIVGGRDLIILVRALSYRDLADYIMGDLESVLGIVSVRTSICIQTVLHRDSWDVGLLTAEQARMRLRAENRRLREDDEIPRRASVFFAEELNSRNR